MTSFRPDPSPPPLRHFSSSSADPPPPSDDVICERSLRRFFACGSKRRIENSTEMPPQVSKFYWSNSKVFKNRKFVIWRDIVLRWKLPDINSLRSTTFVSTYFLCALYFFCKFEKTEKGGFEPPKGGVEHISRSRYESHVKEHIEIHISSNFGPSITKRTV